MAIDPTLNTNLVTTATKYTILNNGTNDNIVEGVAVPGEQSTGTPLGQATAYAFTSGNTGDDRLVDFSSNDSIINYQKIFDGNNDGIINFGANGILDIDRTTRAKAGADQITVGNGVTDLRFLGEKQGGFVYADYRTFTQLDALTGKKTVIEGTVGNDGLDASKGDVVLLYDTALGLNLGGDTIKGFGVGDEIVTTTKIHNGANAGALITFGKNGLLDLPGDSDGIKGDLGSLEGGQLDFGGRLTLALDHVDNGANGATYYHYVLAVPA